MRSGSNTSDPNQGRSLWQVASVYLVGSWGALEAIDLVTGIAGLPDGIPTLALTLLVLGLPFVLVTAFVQRGLADRGGGGAPDATSAKSPALAEPETAHRIFTWRNAAVGGLAALTVLALAGGGYAVMRALGVGPAASLAAQGVLDVADPILLATFESPPSDAELGPVITEALRVDLGSSTAIELVQPARIRAGLTMMRLPADTTVSGSLAVELAARMNAGAVITGGVSGLGSGYLLTASILSPGSGELLAAARRTARDEEELIDAVDGLSQDLRERISESLRSIRRDEALESVTTASLDALREYTLAQRLEIQGEHRRSKEALERAVALDPEFAMAYRQLAVLGQDAGSTLEEERQAATRAYELRDRLTDRERYRTIAYYHYVVTGDYDARLAALEALLERYPDDASGLVQLEIALVDRTRYEDGEPLLRRAIDGPGESTSAWTNRTGVLLGMGRIDEANEHQRLYEERYPGRVLWQTSNRVQLAVATFHPDSVHALGAMMETLAEAPEDWRDYGAVWQSWGDLMVGQVDEARQHQAAAYERAEGQGRTADAALRAFELARLEHLLGTGRADAWADRGVALVEATTFSPQLYAAASRAIAELGRHDDAEAALRRWRQRAGGTGQGTIEDHGELLRILRSAESSAPGSVADALEAWASRRGCPRCELWTIAGLRSDAGQYEAAIDAWEEFLVHGDDRFLGGVRVPLAMAALGRALEAAGRNDEAVDHYREFLRRWEGSDAELRPRVEAVRTRLTALDGG